MKKLSLLTLAHLQRGGKSKKVLSNVVSNCHTERSEASKGKFIKNPTMVALDRIAEGEA